MKLVNSSIRKLLCLTALFGLLYAIGVDYSAQAQEPAPAADATAAPAAAAAPAEAPHKAESKSLWELIKDGGWIMFPLTVISMWCTALIIEGFVRIRLPNFVPPEHLRQLKTAFREENYQQAWRICKSKSSFLTNVLRNGLERVGRGRIACETALAEGSMKESMLFRTKISYLSTIGVVSPMVGLLGTVTGMIKAFQTLGTGGIGDPSKLAAAIGEVLIATAAGLLVAIPAFFLYYFFRNRLQKVIIMAEDAMNQLMGDVKYEELQGIRIGEAFESELTTGGGMPGLQPMMPQGKRMSQAITGVTVACPQCSAPIVTGVPQCSSCGTGLQWN
jgi:biopolymer transport protein ExbB